MNCAIWGGLQFTRGDALIEISCRSLGHGIEDENKLGEEGIEAGGGHSPNVTHRSKHCVARLGNGIEESIMREGTEAEGGGDIRPKLRQRTAHDKYNYQISLNNWII